MTVRLDELHSVSDLHVGGPPGHQVFDQAPLLARVIDHLAARCAGRRIGLVLNGDTVDFLAEAPAAYLDPQGAVAKLDRILAEPEFVPLWDALRRFTATDGALLVFVLGNHDVELALPAVRERLLEAVSGGSAAARGRVVLAFDGAGFRCQVGDRDVLCLHGNEADSWNVVDHRQLLEVSRALNRGRPVEPWTPNAGTKLVIDVMNDIKARMPFVDLLKPEIEATVPILLGTDREAARRVMRLLPVALRLVADAARVSVGLLSAEDGSPPAAAASTEASAEAFVAAAFGSTPARASVDELLMRAERRLDGGEAPGAQAEEGTLGYTRILVDRILGRDPKENLRESLVKWLADDRSFDLTYRDAKAKALDEAVGKEVDFLLAGHTHLARALARKNGRGAYFNSGTWMRLIRLDEAELAKDRFDTIYAQLRSRTMKELDEATDLVLRRPTVVSVVSDDGAVFGELREAADDDAVLHPVPNTRLG